MYGDTLMPRNKTDKISKDCPVCGVKFEVYPSKISQNTCSRNCSRIFYSGENNPNFGKKWSQEKKETQSLIVKSTVDQRYRELAGSANRGKKFSSKQIAAMHENRSKESYSHPHNDVSKTLIGKKSSEKWTQEYKEKNRQTREELGHWVKDSDKSDWEIYEKQSNWIKPMWNLVNDAESKMKLKEHGVFNPIKKKHGVVRDHQFSRKHGFMQGVFPEILRHPCNCQFLTVGENSSKREKSSLTLDQLFSMIEQYNEIWEEQELILNLIAEYRKGNIWKRKEVVSE